ncbi:MAG: tetratricopeptide repeat protein [Nitrospira sp.]|nr:tetratricopeptide repeat protein [Nitrospira sp.]
MDAQTPMSEPMQPGAAAVDPGDQPLSPEEEISAIEKLLAVEPDDFQARCRLGELYFSQGRLDDALAEVKKSIEMAEGLRAEMNRSLAMYYSNLGTIYATKNMTDEAEAEFHEADAIEAEAQAAAQQATAPQAVADSSSQTVSANQTAAAAQPAPRV